MDQRDMANHERAVRAAARGRIHSTRQATKYDLVDILEALDPKVSRHRLLRLTSAELAERCKVRAAGLRAALQAVVMEGVK